jgi:hypothetical protein
MKLIKSESMKFIHLIFFFNLIIANTMFCQVPYADRHSQVISDTWISNVKTLSPNIARGSSHWIRYELGGIFTLGKMKIWNINNVDKLTSGSKSIIIDYSTDGTKWTEWGKFEVPKADGSTLYSGVEGPDFAGLKASHILITIASNHGHLSEHGLAEIKIDASPITVSTKEENILSSSIEITATPNPFSDESIIKISNSELSNLKYQLTDMMGRVMMTRPVEDNNIKIDARALISGIYTFSIIHPTGKKSIQLNVVK